MKLFTSFVSFALSGHLLSACGDAGDEREIPDSDELGVASHALSACSITGIASGTWYSQRNQTWADAYLGNSRTETIGEAGCLLTSLAMAYHDAWGVPTTPLELNAAARAAGCFPKGSPLIDVRCAINTRGGPRAVDIIPLSSVAPAICAGHPVVANVTWGGGHKLLVYAYTGDDASALSSYIAVDPYYGTSKPLTSYTVVKWRELR